MPKVTDYQEEEYDVFRKERKKHLPKCPKTNKVSFGSQELAERRGAGLTVTNLIRGQRRPEKMAVTPYRCPYCKLWHITSQPQ